MTADAETPTPPLVLHDGELARYAMVGARLFYSLYHHPNAAEVMRAASTSRGFNDAYTAALMAFNEGKTRP